MNFYKVRLVETLKFQCRLASTLMEVSVTYTPPSAAHILPVTQTESHQAFAKVNSISSKQQIQVCS